MPQKRRSPRSSISVLLVATSLHFSACATPRQPERAVTPPATPPAQPYANMEDLVIGHSFVMPSAVLGEDRRITVYLPAEYEKNSERHSVLYLLDGGIQEDFHHVTGIVQVSVANGLMTPIIVIGIENTERRRDMTGPTENAEDKKAAPRVGESARFRSFFKDELIPRIERDFRTNGDRTIIGESLAGLFVVETFLTAPEMFGRYIAVSPSLWWNDNALLKQAPEKLRQLPLQGKTLYLTVGGSEDNTKETSNLAATLRTVNPSGLTWHYEPLPDETHPTMLHAGALRALRKFFPVKRQVSSGT